jgi:short-subunit dehydrogenase
MIGYHAFAMPFPPKIEFDSKISQFMQSVNILQQRYNMFFSLPIFIVDRYPGCGYLGFMAGFSLSGKVVWITGASSGIGAALAAEAARRGASVILSGRNEKALLDVAERCKPASIAILPFDLSDSRAREDAVKKALTMPAHPAGEYAFGRVDILLLNAGVSQRSKFLETSPEVFNRIFETNFTASVDLTRLVLPSMLARGSGRIAAVSSIAGLMGAPLRTAYSASKHALQGFFSSLRAELRSIGSGDTRNPVEITMVFPGFVRTEISRNALEGNGEPHGILDPLQDSGQNPEKTARIVWNGIEANRAEIRVAFDMKARFGLFLSRHFPSRFADAISRHGGL